MHRVLLAIFLVFLPLVAGGGGDSVSQESIFWPTDGVGDGTATGYTSDQWKWAMRMMWTVDPTTEGVALGFLNDLGVTNPGGVTLRVASGGGVVYGLPYRNTANVDFTLTTPVINTTGWRLVLRADWAAQTVRLVLLESADGVLAAPGVTQTAGVTWEITLATGTITVVPAVAVTDARAYLEPGIQLGPGRIANRTRRIFVSADTGYNLTDGTDIFQTVSPTGLPFPDDKVCHATSFVAVPKDYVPGTDIIITSVVESAASGNLNSALAVSYGLCAGVLSVTATGNVVDAVILNRFYCVNAYTFTNALPDQLLVVEFARIANVAADTINDSVQFVGWYLDYTADS